MDPKTLSMLQMMMNQPNAQGGQGNPMGMGQQQAPAPQMAPSMAHPHREANPLEIGANSARRSADHTFQMNDDQRRRALGRAIMAFSSHMARPKMEGEYIPGTAGLLASVNASFNPALEAYQNEEAQAHQLNDYAMKQQIQAQKQLQQNNLKLMEFQALQEYRNRSLSNQQTALGIRSERKSSKEPAGFKEIQLYEDPVTGESYDLSGFPKITSRTQENKYVEKSSLLGSTINKIDHIKSEMKEAENITPELLSDPNNPYIKKYKNELQDLTTSFGWNLLSPEAKKERMAERIKRASIDAALKELSISAEKALTGKALTQGMYDRLKGIYPTYNDPWPVIYKRLGDIEDELKPEYKSSILSSTFGKNINSERAKDFPDEMVQGLQRVKKSGGKNDSTEKEPSQEERKTAINMIRQQRPEFSKYDDNQVWQWYLRKSGN